MSELVSKVYNWFPKLLDINQAKQWIDNLANNTAFLIYDNSKLNSYIDPVFLSYASIILIAVALVYVSCFATIEKPTNALPPNPEHPLFDQSDNDTTFVKEASINESSALAMPIVAGLGLIGLYFAIKNFDKEALSLFLKRYVLLLSLRSNSFTITYFIKSIARTVSHKLGISSLKFIKRYTFTISDDRNIHSAGVEENFLLSDFTEDEKIIREEALLEARNDIKKEHQLMNYYFSTADLYGYFFGTLLTIAFGLLDGSDNWLLSNLLAAFSTISCISMARLPSFKPAFIIIGLFFIYDIYFVFGSDVMVEVATNIDIPVKILIPNNVSRVEQQMSMSMLGLGDLVIPGMFISLCLRFDLYNHHEKFKESFYHLQHFDKPYFKSALIGYTIGLLATVSVLHVYSQGQPALLYLSPSLAISVLGIAIRKGDLKRLWSYNEDPNHESDARKREADLNIICSKETLFLASTIAEEDEEDEEDYDYIQEEETNDYEEYDEEFDDE